MDSKIKFSSWIFTLGFTLTSLTGVSAGAQYLNTELPQKTCSGRISDLNCYQNIVNREAHVLNIKDGYVAPAAQYFRRDSFTKATYEGRQILVDIQDQESCRQVTNSLIDSKVVLAKENSLNLDQLCEKDSRSPNERYRSVTLMWETSEDYLTPLNLNFLTNTDKNIVNDTRNLSYLMMATMGILWLLPESVTKWDRDSNKKEGFFNKWQRNASSKPIKDNDDAYINYIGHPISGAVYYTVARSNGYSKMESFGYSVMMSTFFWEYGFESFAERPSVQDLIITPVIGSILGEVFYQWGEKIKANNGKVLGRKSIGNVVLFILNPAEKLSSLINRGLGKKVIKTAESNLVVSRRRNLGNPQFFSNYIGIELKFAF